MSKAKELHVESEHLPLIIAMRSTLGKGPSPQRPFSSPELCWPITLPSKQPAVPRPEGEGIVSISVADINLYIPSKLLPDDKPSAHLLGSAPKQEAQVRFLNVVPGLLGLLP